MNKLGFLLLAITLFSLAAAESLVNESGENASAVDYFTYNVSVRNLGQEFTVTGRFYLNQTQFVLAYSPNQSFQGAVTYKLPLNQSDYEAGLVSFDPEPIFIVSSAGIVAGWDVELDAGEMFEVTVIVGKPFSREIILEFAAPESSNPRPRQPVLTAAMSEEASLQAISSAQAFIDQASELSFNVEEATVSIELARYYYERKAYPRAVLWAEVAREKALELISAQIGERMGQAFGLEVVTAIFGVSVTVLVMVFLWLYAWPHRLGGPFVHKILQKIEKRKNKVLRRSS